MRLYIINWSVKINKLDDRSHLSYFMGYAATTGVIIYWNPYQPFIILGAHHVWFDEYYYPRFISDKHTPVYFLLKQDTEILSHNSDLLNLITCELDLTSTSFCDKKILTY